MSGPFEASKLAPQGRRRRIFVSAGYLVTWLLLALACASVVFLHSSRETTLASHDAVIRPDLSGHVVLLTGPVLPDVRVPSGARVGVTVTLGKTDAPSTADLVDRYALIASQPEGPEARVREVLADLVVDSAVRGGALALLPIVVWMLIGRHRRHVLFAGARMPRTIALLTTVGLVGVLVAQPWANHEPRLDREEEWQPLATFLGPDVPLPAELDGVEAMSPPARPGGSSRVPSGPMTTARPSTVTPPRRPPTSSCVSRSRTRPWSSSSRTGTTTSAWTASHER
jgi:hypothetical protein